MAEGGGGEEAASDSITIRVKDAGGDETFFKVKKMTKMEKILQVCSFRATIRNLI